MRRPGFAALWLASLAAMLRDKGAALLLLGAPVLYGFFYPWFYAPQVVQRVPVALVVQDASGLSRQMLRFAQASPRIDPRLVTADEGLARAALMRGEVQGYALIAPDFKRDVVRGAAVVVPVYANGAYPLAAKQVQYGFAEAFGTVSAGVEIKRLQAGGQSAQQAAASRSPVNLQAVALFNPTEGYGSFVVAAVALLILQQTLLMAAGMLIGTWAEAETAGSNGGEPVSESQKPSAPGNTEPHAVSTSPAGWAGRVIALAIPNALLGAFYFGWLFQWQGYGHGGNVPASVLLIALFSLACAALGCLLGLALRNRERAMQLLLFGALPLFFLSGHPWPVSALPEALQLLRWLSPSTPAIEASIRLNQMGASLADMAPQMLALAVLGATGFAALIRLGSKRR